MNKVRMGGLRGTGREAAGDSQGTSPLSFSDRPVTDLRILARYRTDERLHGLGLRPDVVRTPISCHLKPDSDAIRGGNLRIQ